MVHARFEGLEIDKEKGMDLIQHILKNLIQENMEQLDYHLMMQEIQQIKYKYIIILHQKQFITENIPLYLWIV